MMRRTWEYGTTRRGKAVDAKVLLVIGDDNEGYLIIGNDGGPVAEGDEGTLTFMQGGPTGGYWRFTADPKGEPQDG